VVKGHSQQCAVQRTLEIKQLLKWLRRFCSRSALSPHSVCCGLVLSSLSGHSLLNASRTSADDFRCEMMFESGHTFCSLVHLIRMCIAFAQLVRAAA
jgi:hypothetical protein